METAKIVVQLTEKTREMFELMNFKDIPDEARGIAFFEDGDACFVGDFSPSFLWFDSRFILVNYVIDVDIES